MINNWLLPHETRIIGHRGASGVAPENTLLAFQIAQEVRADGIEFDIQLSLDGVPMVIHDDTVNRTTDQKGKVGSYTADELGKMDAGMGEPIPTLAAVFELLGTKLLYNVEIKDTGWRAKYAVEAVLNVVRRYDMEEYVLLSSFYHRTVKWMHILRPENVLIANLRSIYSSPIPDFFEGGADHPNFELLSPLYMKYARAHDWLIHVWTIDDLDFAHELAQMGVNGIITNKPEEMYQSFYGSSK